MTLSHTDSLLPIVLLGPFELEALRITENPAPMATANQPLD